MAYAAAIHLKSPNKNAENATVRGCQLPKIITARARNPKPATSPEAVALAVVKAKTKPPRPDSAPEIVVP